MGREGGGGGGTDAFDANVYLSSNKFPGVGLGFLVYWDAYGRYDSANVVRFCGIDLQSGMVNLPQNAAAE